MKTVPQQDPAGLRFLGKPFSCLRRVFGLVRLLGHHQKLRGEGGPLRCGLVEALLQGSFLLLEGVHLRF